MLVIKQFGPVTYAMGTLQEILAGTGIAAKVRALPNDVAGCTLEMGADGKWYGDLGTMSKATADALVASGALVNLATGTTYRDTNGTQYTYGRAGWVAANRTLLDRIMRGESLYAYGDSLVEGRNSAGFSGVKCGFIAAAAQSLRAGGFDVSASFGSFGSHTDSVVVDGVTLSTGWTIDASGVAGSTGSAQNGSSLLGSNTTSKLSLLSPIVCDSFELLLNYEYGIPSVVIADSSGGTATVELSCASGLSGIRKYIYKCKVPGKNTLTITPTVSKANGVRIFGWTPTINGNSSCLIAIGVGGAKCCGDYVLPGGAYTTVFNTKLDIQTRKPKISFVMLGTNDQNAGVSVSNFMQSFSVLLGWLKSAGSDVIIGFPPPPNVDNTLLSGYINAINASFPSVTKVDFFNGVFGGVYDPLRMSDTWHPNDNGYLDMGIFLASALSSNY